MAVDGRILSYASVRGSLLVVALLAAAACTPHSVTTMEARAVFVDGSLIVSGATNLPDKAVLSVLGWHNAVSATRLEPVALPGLPVSTTVANGRFDESLDASGWTPGSATIVVMFHPDQQPPAIRDQFGVGGEKLFGPQVREDTDGFRLMDVGIQVDIPS